MESPRTAKAAPTRRRESSKKAILAAALTLAREVGYAKLTIEGIAARAGVGKQTIYRWWPSKGSVLFEALLAASEAPDGSPELPDTGDIEVDLKFVLKETVKEFNDPGYDSVLRALTVEIVQDSALAEDYAARLDKPMRELKKRRLRAAQEAGQISPDADIEVAVDMIWGVVANRWLTRGGPLTEEFSDAVVETVLAGLRPKPL
jgi:AcrR family transcriptional regulator